MGADLYREPKPGSNPEREAAIKTLEERSAAGEDIFTRGGEHPSWGEIHNHPDWYFRDSYNESNLLWMVDMHYWSDDEDSVKAYCGPNGDGVLMVVSDADDVDEHGVAYTYEDMRLFPPGCIRLADELARRSELLIRNCRAKGYPDRPENKDDWSLTIEYFDKKLQRFIAFLRTVAEAGDTIHCSV